MITVQNNRSIRLTALSWVGSAVLFSFSVAFAQSPQRDDDLRAEIVNKALNKSKLREIQVSVYSGVVTLTGKVEVFDLKEEANKRVHRIKGVQGVMNQIEVDGPEIPDPQLQQSLVKAISYDRVGYGTTPFNAISVQVHDGAVTLGGRAYGPVDADSAVALAANILRV